MDYKTVTPEFAVAPQIQPNDIETIKNLGYVAIINNRPDDETPDQPATGSLAKMASEAGLQYYDIPIRSGTLSAEAIDETRNTINSIDGPVFAFCRSGTRSITLWALAQIGQKDGQEILSAVASAGYDLPFLAQFITPEQ
jgi:uncharacterized protein (TIGR01244 family)